MTELIVPESKDVVRSLPSETLYKLEVAGEIATEVLDERVIEWIKEGQSQEYVSDEIGCTQQAVSKRIIRIEEEQGIVLPRDPRGSYNRVVKDDESSFAEEEEEEVEPTEVLPPIPRSTAVQTAGACAPINPSNIVKRIYADALTLKSTKSKLNKADTKLLRKAEQLLSEVSNG